MRSAVADRVSDRFRGADDEAGHMGAHSDREESRINRASPTDVYDDMSLDATRSAASAPTSSAGRRRAAPRRLTSGHRAKFELLDGNVQPAPVVPVEHPSASRSAGDRFGRDIARQRHRLGQSAYHRAWFRGTSSASHRATRSSPMTRQSSWNAARARSSTCPGRCRPARAGRGRPCAWTPRAGRTRRDGRARV